MLQVLGPFIITLVTSSCFYSIKSHPMASEEDLVPDKDVESVCNTMRTLDHKLTETFTNLPEDGGKDVIKQMKSYNEAARILLEHCKQDKYKAFPPAKDLLERGGAEFLDVDVDISDLEDKFGWGKEDLENIHNLKKRTNIVWYDLWRLYNNIPIPDS